MEPFVSLTIGVTTFRPETVPFAEAAMRGAVLPQHQRMRGVILLEEPRTPGFDEMLVGDMDPEAYLMLTEFAFPEYGRRTCRMLQGLQAEGADIRQVHPWMDELVAIHEFFAGGGTPEGIDPDTTAGAVYAREKAWTADLLAFYETAAGADFDALVASVRAFAKADAAKIADQDAMRLKAVLDTLAAQPEGAPVYVEAGSIHHALVKDLAREASCGTRCHVRGRVRVAHLMEEVVRRRYGRRRIVPPGDALTFRYLLGAPEDADAEALLAARAVVYNQLIEKAELTAGDYLLLNDDARYPRQADDARYPHLANEAQVVGLVGALSYAECAALWPKLRGRGSEAAMALVRGRQ